MMKSFSAVVERACPRWKGLLPLVLLVLLACSPLAKSPCTQTAGSSTSQENREALLQEHVFGGAPSGECAVILVRNRYVLCYDPTLRSARWVAYCLTPDCLKVPEGDGCLQDPEVNGEPSCDDYAYEKSGYEHGHLFPRFAAGGDRQTDWMTNIVPQRKSFNQSGGLWYSLETKIRKFLKSESGRTVDLYVFAGPIYGPGEIERTGRNRDLPVPSMFFEILIRPQPTGSDPLVLTFLFPHQRVPHGSVEDFIVTVNVVEAISGFDFFTDLAEEIEQRIESNDTDLLAQILQ